MKHAPIQPPLFISSTNKVKCRANAAYAAGVAEMLRLLGDYRPANTARGVLPGALACNRVVGVAEAAERERLLRLLEVASRLAVLDK